MNLLVGLSILLAAPNAGGAYDIPVNKATIRPTAAPVAPIVTRVEPTPVPRKQASAPSGNSGDILDRIAKCESGGNPKAISSNGTYRGAWQFSLSTWHSNGGSGDPINYSYAEQKQIAQNLYNRRGTQPWPTCGRR